MNVSNEEFIELISKLAIKELKNDMKYFVPVGVSNRHVHLNRKDLDVLFGEGYQLTKFKDLKQPGQYACKETVTIKGSKGEFINVRILGPLRDETQVEISVSDGFKLGLRPPMRESGKLDGSSGVTIEGPCGKIIKSKGCIVAWRHIHMDTDTAKSLNLNDKDIVEVKVFGERNAVLGNVLVRVSKNYSLEIHIDVDEANACGLINNDTVRVVTKG